MRLNSTGLGIGTSSPAFKLQVIGASQIQTNAAGTQQVLQLNNSDTTAGTQAVKLGFSSAGSTKSSINAAVYGNDYMTFNVGSDTERMRLDSSGNLGLSVTPSAWSGFKAIDVNTISSFASATNRLQVAYNSYWNGSNYIYKTTAEAARYDMITGQHQWYTAPSGTAGNAISFTQAMTLTAAGGLTVGGTTDPGAGRILAEGSGTSHYVASSKAGITTTYLITDASGANVQVDGGWPIRFTTNSAERARITSGGFFKASNTGTYAGSTSAYHELRSDQQDQNIVLIRNTNATSPYGIDVAFTAATPNNTTNTFITSTDSTNDKFIVYSSGTVTNRTGTYNAFSDLKLKQDVVDAGSQWNDIKALRVRKFRLKDEVAANPNYPAYIGLIAQEAEQVSPGLVEECADFERVEVVDEDGNVTYERKPAGTTTKSVKYSILYMKAVKALQEAMARIEKLEAEMAALKGA
jgi:hypothetical protein